MAGIIQNMSVEQNLDVHFAKGPPGSDPADALFLGGLFAVLGSWTVRR